MLAGESLASFILRTSLGSERLFAAEFLHDDGEVAMPRPVRRWEDLSQFSKVALHVFPVKEMITVKFGLPWGVLEGYYGMRILILRTW